MAKALKIASVGPVMVTIRSGQFPSEMLIRAPLCRVRNNQNIHDYERKTHIRCDETNGLFVGKLYLRLRAFSSPFLLSGSKEKDRLLRCVSHRRCDALHALLVVSVINTFPMMLPTSCTNTNKQC